MIRVLHIMGCADAGGISSVVLNYYRFLDRSKIHFDVALTVPEAGQNANALRDLGAEIFFLPLKSQGLSAFREALQKLLREGCYDAIHVHESETCYVALKIAKDAGIPCRVAHSHTTSPWEGIKGEIRRLSGCVLNYHYATCVIGCGRLAGERVFGKWNMKRPKALVLPNAVDCQRFAFDPAIRARMREELAVEGKLVLGMVGRLCQEKNYPFALELMARLTQQDPECVLVIAGNGESEQSIREQIQRLGLENRVKLLGRRGDVPRLCQAFDVFVMPSLTEGYPVAAVEAMASGLPVLLADTITPELTFASAAKYLPLNDPERWVTEIERWKQDQGRTSRQAEVKEHGLEIRDSVRLLEKIYERDCNGV